LKPEGDVRILGVDYGAKRIGLAVCDRSETIASPLTTWATAEADARRFADLVQVEEIEAIVVGLPIRTDGVEGPEARNVRAFADGLREAMDVPVELFDERFSTQRAERAMLSADLSRQKRRDRIDQLAAQAILDAYLRHRQSSG
jgi:putative Holliday junction resolvase